MLCNAHKAVIAFTVTMSLALPAQAQSCGGSGGNGMSDCGRGDPNVPLVPKPFDPRPAGPDTMGPGRSAPASGFPAQDRGQMRGQTPPGAIANH